MWRCQSGIWTAITPTSPGATSYGALTLDPRDSRRVIVATYDSNSWRWIWRSDDRGATWTEVGVGNMTVPTSWNRTHLWGWSGQLACDPGAPGRLSITTGYGALATDDYRAAAPVWRAPMHGVEEAVGMHLRALPAAGGGRLIAAVQDSIGYTLDPADIRVPAGSWRPDTFGIATGIDSCVADPLTVAWVGSDEHGVTPYSGLSRDGGRTWSPLPNAAPGMNSAGVFQGNIAIACDDRDSFVWVPQTAAWADNGKGAPGTWYTRDAGATWWRASGLPDRIPPLDQQFFPSEVLVADRAAAGTFYLVSSNDGLGRCWRSTDYGATWQLRSSGTAFPNAQGTASSLHPYSWIVKARTIPGRAGELWVAYASGNAADDQLLLRSTDGGATWSDVRSVGSCWSVAFGAPAPGRGNPAVFVHARIAGVVGIFRSDDVSSLPGEASGATWIRVSTDDDAPHFRNGIVKVEGDPSIHGRVYVASSGQGIWRGERVVGNAAPTIATVAVAAPAVLVLP